MLDTTIINTPEIGYEVGTLDNGHLPPSFVFPAFNLQSFMKREVTVEFDGTLDFYKSEDASKHQGIGARTKLFEEIYQAFQFARHTFSDLDETRLEVACLEAQLLAASNLFGEEITPNVSVDPYGEFTFSHRSSAGYVDIGVRGEGELSYHVRNDVHPDETKFDDYVWADYEVPQPLFGALGALRELLQSR